MAAVAKASLLEGFGNERVIQLMIMVQIHSSVICVYCSKALPFAYASINYANHGYKAI